MTNNFKHITKIDKESQSIVDLKRIKQFLRIDHDDEDELLILFEKSAVEEVEHIIGKSILPAKWKQDSEILLDNYDSDFRFSFPFSADSSTYIRLYKRPILSVTNVIADGKSLDPSAYSVILDQNIPYLQIKNKGLVGFARSKKIQVGIFFETGEYLSAESVPEKIKLAILLHISKNFFYRDVMCAAENSSTESTMKNLLSQFRDYFMD